MASHRQIPGSAAGSVSSSSPGIHRLNFPFGDTTHTKVFVGGLAWETNSEGLHRHFQQNGEILEAVVISDKNTGRSKGYGFVTFGDPESARRACSDPNPVIDGRRANCNLASLGRPGIAHFHARMRSASPSFGGSPVSRGPYFGSHAYQQTIPYYYPQGFAYPPYGYGTYGPEVVYSQNIRNTYMHPYVQVHGISGTVNPAVYPFAPFIQPLPSGNGPQGYALPANQLVMQFTRPNLSGMAAGPMPSIQAHAQYPPVSGLAVLPAPPSFVVASPSPQFSQGSAPDQMAG